MKSLKQIADNAKDVLKPLDKKNFEVLVYYGLVASKLQNFLGNREIAVKNHIGATHMPYLIKRGSKEKPLSVKELVKSITPEFLETRKNIESLKSARGKISAVQEKIWGYFLPRKLSDFFYATNHEGVKKSISRVFYDIDIGSGATSKQAQNVTKKLVEIINSDNEAGKYIKGEPFVFWTGSSFHVYLRLKATKPHTFYEKNIRAEKGKELGTWTEKWVKELRESFKNIKAGHEKTKKYISVDPSQTPSGKLARVPFSLHCKAKGIYDGVAIPLKKDMLDEKNLISELNSYTPEKVLDELNNLSKRIPKAW